MDERQRFDIARAALMAVAILMATACDSDNPVGPDRRAAADHQAFDRACVVLPGAIVDICHRVTGATGYVPLTIDVADLDFHLAHGDAPVGYPVPGQAGLKFDRSCRPVPLVSVTITFEGLHGRPDRSPLPQYFESGFRVTPAPGRWVVFTDPARPASAIGFSRLAEEPTMAGEVTVDAGGAPFSVSSLDVYSSITEIPYTITGLVDGCPVFTVSAVVPHTFGHFVTVHNPHSTHVIDALLILLSNPASACCPNPVGLDNIVLTR